jgi:hypothetical protein
MSVTGLTGNTWIAGELNVDGAIYSQKTFKEFRMIEIDWPNNAYLNSRAVTTGTQVFVRYGTTISFVPTTAYTKVGLSPSVCVYMYACVDA